MARKKREFITPDLTPLIDVVFLLLIFFLVSSVFKKDEYALLLNLPVTEEGEGVKKKVEELTIEINKDSYALNKESVSITELTAKLNSYEASIVVNIRADQESPYKRLIKVLETLQSQKKENISLITEKETK